MVHHSSQLVSHLCLLHRSHRTNPFYLQRDFKVVINNFSDKESEILVSILFPPEFLLFKRPLIHLQIPLYASIAGKQVIF